MATINKPLNRQQLRQFLPNNESVIRLQKLLDSLTSSTTDISALEAAILALQSDVATIQGQIIAINAQLADIYVMIEDNEIMIHTEQKC